MKDGKKYENTELMQKCCDRLKIPHTVFSSVEDFASLPARTVSVVLLSCSASSLGARDESCEMGRFLPATDDDGLASLDSRY